MKRMLFALALACLATVGFAEGLSAGIGASGSSFKYEAKLTFDGTSSGATVTGIPLNLMGYVETTYLQFAIGYRRIDGVHIEDETGGRDDSTKFTYLSFAGFGKFPIQIGLVTVIPMAGIEYDFMVYGTDDSGTLSKQERGDWSSLWIRAGVGAEIPVTAVFYIRPQVLLGYQLNNQNDKNQIDSAKSSGASDASVRTVELQVGVLVGIKL